MMRTCFGMMCFKKYTELANVLCQKVAKSCLEYIFMLRCFEGI